MKYTAGDITKLGTILGIWAHPDDESWCMGGVMAMAVANGQRVVCITATRGSAGQTADETRWPKSRLGDIRTHEIQKAMKVLGVAEHIWLEHEDGKLPQADSETASWQIAKYIDEIKPDSIFSFGPDGITGHDDHRAVYTWTRRAIELSGSNPLFLCAVELREKYESAGRACHEKFNIYFNIGEPLTIPKKDVDAYVELPPEILAQKVESLKVQKSQTAGMFADAKGYDYVLQSCVCEAFMKAKVQ